MNIITWGGAVYAKQTLNIFNVYFAKNKVDCDGGAVNSGLTMNVDHCLFESK